MLLVFGTHGSPGATTSCIFTAALWTAGSRSVGLVDADPTGGTLAAHLRLFQDPGVASLIINNTIDADTLLTCSQNVLVEKLHVLPLPTSASGSSIAVERLAERGLELAQVSTQIPLIVDAGRAYFGTPVVKLIPHASAVLFVMQSAHPPALSSMLFYRQMLGIDAESLSHSDSLIASRDKLEALLSNSFGLITIGPKYFSDEEFEEQIGLPVIASFPYDPLRAYDFGDTLLGVNRASKRFLHASRKASDAIWQFAYPSLSQKITTEEIYVDDPFALAFEDPESIAAASEVHKTEQPDVKPSRRFSRQKGG